jgi:hypothetical protein
MERIEPEVRRELARFGAPGGMPRLLEAWPDAVGPEIARNAWPARIARDRTLHVAASSSAWAFELSQLAPEILTRLRDRLGEDAPPALRFAPGHVPEPDEASFEMRPPTRLDPAPEERAQAALVANEIRDEELREKVQRAAAASLALGRSGRPV